MQDRDPDKGLISEELPRYVAPFFLKKNILSANFNWAVYGMTEHAFCEYAGGDASILKILGGVT